MDEENSKVKEMSAASLSFGHSSLREGFSSDEEKPKDEDGLSIETFKLNCSYSFVSVHNCS